MENPASVSTEDSKFNYSEAAPSPMPPPYANPAQYPPTSGIPYPQQYPTQTPAMGYPQPYAPPPGQPYYPQPVFYPGQPGMNYQAPQQQQQQQVVIVNNQQPVVVVAQPTVSMTGAVALSCIAYWCFGFVFGGIAFILAKVGESSAADGDTRAAVHLRNASYGVSVAGIIIGIIIISVVASSIAKNSSSSCTYVYYGGTYRCN